MMAPVFLELSKCVFRICLSVLIPFLIQGLGTLGEKFPSVANATISSLRDFLMNPSRVLVKLQKHYVAESGKSAPVIRVSDASTPRSKTGKDGGTGSGSGGSARRSSAIHGYHPFERLRNAAISNLCR